MGDAEDYRNVRNAEAWKQRIQHEDKAMLSFLTRKRNNGKTLMSSSFADGYTKHILPHLYSYQSSSTNSVDMNGVVGNHENVCHAGENLRNTSGEVISPQKPSAKLSSSHSHRSSASHGSTHSVKQFGAGGTNGAASPKNSSQQYLNGSISKCLANNYLNHPKYNGRDNSQENVEDYKKRIESLEKIIQEEKEGRKAVQRELESLKGLMENHINSTRMAPQTYFK